ncbi:37697_t:CDS:2 [Gigaspora margarita]|uniref:37697_t:CDS:1 n=1 Tax=Gigaspora margarita TaxID=4874 RepID=A0ABM8VVR6_GIGMA|nr:37697_t:CDS:2 [Gigaspora margarita]
MLKYNSKAPSKEILDSLLAQQKIEVLKLCYNLQQKLLNKLLEKKRIEQAIIKIPTIQLSKRDKNQLSKIKLWKLSDFTLHIEVNKIVESTMWSQLGYLARESWIKDIVQECLKQKLMDSVKKLRNKGYLIEDNIVNLELNKTNSVEKNSMDYVDEIDDMDINENIDNLDSIDNMSNIDNMDNMDSINDMGNDEQIE